MFENASFDIILRYGTLIDVPGAAIAIGANNEFVLAPHAVESLC